MTQLDNSLATIRQAAQTLPNGKRNQVLNRCDRISLLMKEQNKAIVDRDSVNKRIVAALIAGRRLSYKNQNEFMTSEFHTAIVYVRRILERDGRYVLKSEWVLGDGHPYKIYWADENI